MLLLALMTASMHMASSPSHTQTSVQLFNTGRYLRAERSALRTLEQTPAARNEELLTAHIVHALALEKRAHRSEALEAWETLEGTEEFRLHLGNFAAVNIARLASATGNCALIKEQASTLSTSSIFFMELWTRAVHCSLRQKDLPSAKSSFEHISTEHPNERIRLLRAKLALAERNFDEAANDFQWIMLHAPSTPAVQEARALVAQWKRKGLPTPSLSLRERLYTADLLRGRHLHDKAAKVLTDIKRRAASSRALYSLYQSAELRLIEIGMVDQEYSIGLARVDKMVWARDIGVRTHARFIKADLLTRLGRSAEALRQIDTMLRRNDVSDKPYAIESALLALRLADAGHYPNRTRRYTNWLLHKAQSARATVILGDDGVFQFGEDLGGAKGWAHWYLANNERRTGAPAELVDQHLAAITTQHPMAAGAQYWRARLATEQDDHEAARILITSFQARFSSHTYYGLRTSQLALGLGMPRTLVRPVRVEAFTSAQQKLQLQEEAQDLRGLLMLQKIGLGKMARSWLKTLAIPKLQPGDKTVAAWLYRMHDEPLLSTQVAQAALRQQHSTPSPLLLGLAAPREFSTLVESASTAYNTSAPLVWAIMRTESGFNRYAHSARDARGLMQMIPKTAKRLARQEGIKHFRVEQLTRPEISIRLGAAYIAELLGEFENHLALTIAAYHAGAPAVRRWVNRAETLRSDILVESIPYVSTRTYVQKVLLAFAAYQQDQSDFASALVLRP